MTVMTVSTAALNLLAEALRGRRRQVGTRWRVLSAGRQALLVLAHLRTGETYADLAVGFDIGLSTTYRYVREALQVLAATAPTLEQAVQVAASKAYVTVDGTVLRIDRVAMTSGNDRPYYSGKHKAHGVNEQVIADPVGRLIWASPALPGPRHAPDTDRRHRPPQRAHPGRDQLLSPSPGHRVGQGDVDPGDGRGPGPSARLQHIAVQHDRVLPQRRRVDHSAKAASDQPGDLMGPSPNPPLGLLPVRTGVGVCCAGR
jgi:pyruvate/2-oxoglutarate dehydrogenase complex dihydrolipoamide acyltransferase (E2) component